MDEKSLNLKGNVNVSLCPNMVLLQSCFFLVGLYGSFLECYLPVSSELQSYTQLTGHKFLANSMGLILLLSRFTLNCSVDIRKILLAH